MDGADTLQSDTTCPAKKIEPIKRDIVHKICSGQVVLSLAIAVKELIENSLDAGATSVEIRMKEYGQELIEVIDNGSGVHQDNFSGLTLKHHTSKLSDFSDLLGVSTFGFRGEALSSLCNLSDLTITTRHSSTELGTKINYDYKGHIKDMSPCARQVGTTVALCNLFSTLPVRQRELRRNIKREFAKMTQLLYAYCIISEGKKIVCTNLTCKGNKSVVVATQGGSLRDNIASVFGIRQLDTLMDLKPDYGYLGNVKEKIFSELELEKKSCERTSDEQIDMDIKVNHDLELSEESSNDASNTMDITSSLTEEYTSSQKTISSRSDSSPSICADRAKQPFDFRGYISSCAHGSGRSTTERQFLYVNSRPCESQKVTKLINEVYKQFNPHQNPFVVMNIHVKQSSVDVNVTPDKRQIYLDKEKCLIGLLKLSLNKLYANIPSTVKIENVNNVSQKLNNNKNDTNEASPRVFSSFLSQFTSKSQSNNTPIYKQKNHVEIKRKAQTMDSFISVKIPKKESPEPCDIEENSDASSDHSIDENITKYEDSDEYNEESAQKSSTMINKTPQDNKETVFLNYSEDVPMSQVVDVKEFLKNNINPAKSKDINHKKCIPSDNSRTKLDVKNQTIKTDDNRISLKPPDGKIYNINVTIDNIRSLAFDDAKNKANKGYKIERVKFRSGINPVLNKKCEEELQKELSKEMFCQMKIIGQFNLGFIITQFEEDLFLVDQHATDEKHNYETLQKTTVLSNQKLVVPQSLELTGLYERVLMDNLEICEKNGFTFEIDENAPPTKKVKLLTIPISKNIIFGKEDIEELLFMLKDAPNEICRPSRIQTMFASRACRKSVMIGTALTKTVMRQLIDNMSYLDQPWNCPHGRPTIRHLVNMGLVELKKSSS